MRRYLEIFANGVAILLVILLFLWSMSTLAWNSWVTNVYLAGQPGNTKEDVERLLGPLGNDLPLEKLAGYPTIRRIANADRATMYHSIRWLLRQPVMWDAIIVYDKSGKVVTSRIYSYSDNVRDE
jgi:hypothetical protein